MSETPKAFCGSNPVRPEKICSSAFVFADSMCISNSRESFLDRSVMVRHTSIFSQSENLATSCAIDARISLISLKPKHLVYIFVPKRRQTPAGCQPLSNFFWVLL